MIKAFTNMPTGEQNGFENRIDHSAAYGKHTAGIKTDMISEEWARQKFSKQMDTRSKLD